MESPPPLGIDLDLPQTEGHQRNRRGCQCSADFCRCVVGECLCTFFFILIAGTLDVNWGNNTGSTPCPSANSAAEDTASASLVETAGASRVVQIALTLGLGVGTLTQCFEHISGAHMNPAVTVAYLVTRQVGLLKGITYIVVQFVGGFTAVFLLHGFLPLEIQGNLGYTAPSSLVSYHQAFGMELLMTFLFVFATLSSTDKHRGLPKAQSLQIGFAFTLVTLWGFSFTGAIMNPVRTLAPTVIITVPPNMWLPILEMYIAGPLLGSIGSALIYRYVFNMHRRSLDLTNSQRGSSMYDPDIDPTVLTLRGLDPYRGKLVSEM